MANTVLFPVINLADTGRSIERCRKEAGLSVRDVQNYFGFEYPQAVYKWQHGECLPSVDNLLALARLLQVKMEDLLVYDDQEVPLFYIHICEKERRWGSAPNPSKGTGPFGIPALRAFVVPAHLPTACMSWLPCAGGSKPAARTSWRSSAEGSWPGGPEG